MKDELAERILAGVLGWKEEEVVRYVQDLQTLADLKYDDYEGYKPGVKFLETLAAWLKQFTEPERKTAVEFVLRKLVFVSRAELYHLIELVYPTIIRRTLIGRIAADRIAPAHQVSRILASPEFRSLERRTLMLGLSDGARFDKLRRASPLSTEQFHLAPELEHGRAEEMRSKLAEALTKKKLPGEHSFRHVFLVEDFSGSGFSLLSFRKKTMSWGGKLWRIKDRLEELRRNKVLSADCLFSVLVYVVSSSAQTALVEALEESGLKWALHAALVLPPELSATISSPDFSKMCSFYYDSSIDDEHKENADLGFAASALPLVLHHNTPNNSVSLLWADTQDSDQGKHRIALFPRYERHHRDRP